MGNLSSSDRMIAISAGLVVILSLYALFNAWGGLVVVPLLTALAALVILFLPAISPNTKAPGSKGSLLMVSGVLAALFWLLAALTWIGWIVDHLGSFDTWLFLIGFAVTLWFGWLCWSAFQAEGGKFQFGKFLKEKILMRQCGVESLQSCVDVALETLHPNLSQESGEAEDDCAAAAEAPDNDGTYLKGIGPVHPERPPVS